MRHCAVIIVITIVKCTCFSNAF